MVLSEVSWDSKSLVLSTDLISIEFHNHSPEYWVRIPSSENNITYIIRYERVVEFLDTDDVSGYSDGDVVILEIPLCDVDWSITHEYIGNDSIGARVVLKSNVTITDPENGTIIGNASFSIVNHIYTIKGMHIKEYPVMKDRELKIDFYISWPRSSSDSLLALIVSFQIVGRDTVEKKFTKDKIKYDELTLDCVRLSGVPNEYVEFRYLNYSYELPTFSKKNVTITQLLDEYPGKIIFTYSRGGRSILHDHSILAYAYPTPRVIDLPPYYMGQIFIITCMLIVAGVLIILLRKIKKQRTSKVPPQSASLGESHTS